MTTAEGWNDVNGSSTIGTIVVLERLADAITLTPSSSTVEIGQVVQLASQITDPSGNVLHQSQVGTEMIPIAVDFAQVRREREQGLRSNLGQPLKSFRDRDCDFAVYRKESAAAFPYLQSLGPLTKPD